MKSRKCAYITGGSSGIGLALAQEYVRMGWDVVLLARDVSKLVAARVSCLKMAGNAAQSVGCESVDVTAYSNLPDEIERLVARYGLPDLLILSAGIAGNKTFLETSSEEFDRVVDINLAGSREVARSLLPAILARGSGKIAFVSSTAGLIGIYGYSAYSASKFAVTGMVQALRQELAGTGVSVHLICPPEVNTPMIAAESQAPVPQTRFLKDLLGTLEPPVAARKIVRGISRSKAQIIPGVRARGMVWLARSFPELFSRCIELLLRWRFR